VSRPTVSWTETVFMSLCNPMLPQEHDSATREIRPTPHDIAFDVESPLQYSQHLPIPPGARRFPECPDPGNRVHHTLGIADVFDSLADSRRDWSQMELNGTLRVEVHSHGQRAPIEHFGHARMARLGILQS